MKRMILLSLILLVSFPLISAINVEVQKVSSDETYILDANQPLKFALDVTNNRNTGNFNFFNLLGVSIEPEDYFEIKQGETKRVEMQIWPREDFDTIGFYTLDYFIQAEDGSEKPLQITFKSLMLKDAFEIGSNEIEPQTNKIKIFIRNKENFDFGTMDTKFTSPFFERDEQFTLGPYERKTFEITLNQEDFESLLAGFYTLNANIDTQGKKAMVEGQINFIEKKIVTENEADLGWVVHTKTIKKINEGNTIVETEVVVEKNIISRLFTSFSPKPDAVDRKGMTTIYTWDREINPGETLDIKVKTNWLLPFIIIIFVVLVVVGMKMYSKKNININKKVSFVSTKGGEFALKVTLVVKANNYTEKVNVVDRLPPMVKLYEKFLGDRPTRTDEKNRRIEWNFEKLEAGEMRVMNYIIYSKLGVMGKFILPSATAVFEKDGKIHEVQSNKAFFVSEQRTKDVGEY